MDVYRNLFIITQNWKQPICPSVGEWIDCGISQKKEHCSVLKRNELSSYEKTWNKLKCLLVS